MYRDAAIGLAPRAKKPKHVASSRPGNHYPRNLLRHYCARQSRIINQHSGRNSIPSFLVISLYVLSYASLVLLVGYFLVDEGHPAAIASDSADKLWMLLVLTWGFYARNRVNGLASFASDDPRWISGLWTFLFSPLYFNYKINVINEATIAAQAVA